MDIFDRFHAAADPERAVKMSAYMRDQFLFRESLRRSAEN